MSRSSYHANKRKKSVKEHGSNCRVWERETQSCRVDKDNVNLSGVTGVPAAAHSTSDWQIESVVFCCSSGLSGEIYNNYM